MVSTPGRQEGRKLILQLKVSSPPEKLSKYRAGIEEVWVESKDRQTLNSCLLKN